MKMLSKIALSLSGVSLLCGGVMASGGRVLHVIVPETGKVIGELRMKGRQKRIITNVQDSTKDEISKLASSLEQDKYDREVNPQATDENVKKSIDKEAFKNALRKELKKRQQIKTLEENNNSESQKITDDKSQNADKLDISDRKAMLKALQKKKLTDQQKQEEAELSSEILSAIRGLSPEKLNKIRGNE